jgi:hypothetical protein
MNTTGQIIILLGIFLLLGLFIWSLICLRKQAIKDWETLNDLTKKAETLSTKQEIEEFYKDFVDKSSKIKNELITPHLIRIDGYVRGIYKQFKQ